MVAESTVGGVHLVKGVKSRNVSIKIFKKEDSGYLVQRKRYFLNVCVRKAEYSCNTIFDAEDKFLELKRSI